MNTADLLREKTRLEGVIEDAKTAKTKIATIERMLVLYGDDTPAAQRTNGSGNNGGKRRVFTEAEKQKFSKQAIAARKRDETWGSIEDRLGVRMSVLRSWIAAGYGK